MNPKAKADLIRLFPMPQVTIRDIIDAMDTKFSLLLDEKEVYSIAEQAAQDLKNRMVHAISTADELRISDIWMLIASERPAPFCTVMDNETELILAHSASLKLLEAIKDAIGTARKRPKRFVTYGVQNVDTITKAYPKIMVERLENTKHPVLFPLAEGIVRNVEDTAKLRMKRPERRLPDLA